MPNNARADRDRPLLSIRATIILVTAMIFGVVTGALTFVGGAGIPQALLAAGATAGATVPALNGIVGGPKD